MWRRWSVLATTAVSVFGIQTAQTVETSNNSAETAEVTVTGEETGSLTSVSPEGSAKQKMQIPGAFTVKTTVDMDLGRASNFEDLLQRTPGVSFNRKTVQKFPRFRFEDPESHLKMSRLE